jgi:hypothetical protein
MPRVGFEATISVFERAKTVLALDRAATSDWRGLYLGIIAKSDFPLTYHQTE